MAEYSVNGILNVSQLSVRFGSKQVLSDVSAKVKSGEKIAIAGESGSGKTTLLKCIMGFVPMESGSVHIDGDELTPHSVWELRHKLGYIPQEPDLGLVTVETAIHQPFLFKVNRKIYPDTKSISELFHTFRLEMDLLNKNVTQLSGGEKQRITLITALLLRRRLYLLDEATSALDDVTRETVVDYFQKQSNLSLLTVTHDPRLLSLCNRVYILDKSGRLMEQK